MHGVHQCDGKTEETQTVLALEEVLKDAIKPYAFYASEYPLILSIENHCSKKQQDRMAEHFKNILGKEVDEYFLKKVSKKKSEKNGLNLY